MVNVYYNEPTFDIDYTTNNSTPITTNNRTTPASDSDKHFEVEMQQWMNKRSSEFVSVKFFQIFITWIVIIYYNIFRLLILFLI